LDFLRLFYQARLTTFTSKNIKSVFQTVKIVLFDPQKLLSRLKIRTPRPPPQLQNPDNHTIVKTPYNTTDFQANILIIQHHHIQGSEPVPDPGFTQVIHYIIKDYNLNCHEITLLKEENDRLRIENGIRKSATGT